MSTSDSTVIVREMMKRKLLMALTILSLSTATMDHSRIHKEDGNSRYSSNEEFSKDKEKYNYVPTLTSLASRNEIVVEKFVDTMLSSEHYLKKIVTIEEKLTHLNSFLHNKTNIILKYLSEVIRLVNTSPVQVMESAVQSLKGDFNKIKHMLKQRVHPIRRVEGGEYRLESSLENRLKFVEDHVKSIMTSVESISGVISEVKHRQNTKNYHRPEVGGSLDALSLISEFRRALYEQKPKKCECKIGRMDRNERYPTDCHEIQMQGFNISGIYKIKPDDMEAFYVLCDLSTAGGGWTVFQNRFDGSQNFYKSWSEYKYGFGNLAGEFWLGLEQLHYLTSQKLYELRIELETQHGRDAFASYSVLTIAPEHEGYRISTLGSFHGSAGDSLSYHAGQKFSTHDADHDEWKEGSCAKEHGGAWWYKECDKSNLNGKYTLSAEEAQGQNIYWISFKAPTVPITKTRMMIRPLPASKPIDYNQHPRKTVEGSKLRGAEEHQAFRVKEPKLGYEVGHHRKPYRYEVPTRDDVFFPNYT